MWPTLILIGIPLNIALILLILSIRKKYIIETKSKFLEYSIMKKGELDEKISMEWNMFYESYLYVYSNQHLVPSDKEFLEFRRNFLGYFKTKLSIYELKEYYEIFYDEKIFNEYIEYEFLRKFQKVFIGSVLEELTSLIGEQKRKNESIVNNFGDRR